MFQNRYVVENPSVLRRENLFENKFVYRVTLAKGVYCRVIPSTWKEICYLRLLEKGVTYEVPSEGNGLFITFKAMPKK
tara:strand:+ start:172 stop:405 length:234 start_codon:yes stop_codon:yes gene_type:complete